MPPNAKKSAAITSFFKPVERTHASSQTKTLTPDVDDLPPLPSSSRASSSPSRDSPTLPSSPASLPPSASSSRLGKPGKPAGLDRNHVFAASDEEEGEDEDTENGSSDLEDLMDTFNAVRANRSPAKRLDTRTQLETPRKAKRIATDQFLESPLSIRHKFDLNSLAKDARRENRMATNSRQLKGFSKGTPSHASGSDEELDDDALAEAMHRSSGGDAHKVLRAVQRAGPKETQMRYYFFVGDYKRPKSKPIPRGQAFGPWKPLLKGSNEAREEYLTSGIPHMILDQGGFLPDEVFDWLLDELCVQASLPMQHDYCHLISSCNGHVTHILPPERVEGLFFRLGAKDKLNDLATTLDQSMPETYEGRDWTNLKSFMSLLKLISEDLSAESTIYSIQMLLRMSADEFLLDNVDILVGFESALSSLLKSEKLKDCWDEFCSETAQLMCGWTSSVVVQLNVVTCMPVRNAASHDLRRRLALSVLFKKHASAALHPDDILSLRDITELVKNMESNLSEDTDFPALCALIVLLDIAVDDGSFSGNGPEDEQEFNVEVDKLAVSIQNLWTSINDIGMKMMRTETKAALDSVQKRLLQAVRTRHKIKQGVFDLREKKEKEFLPEQQDYMRRFLGKPATDKKST